MSIKKHIPNTITCMNLVSGCIASVMAFKGNLDLALVWIIMASVFDFFDGLAARLLNSYSEVGKELDSLADVVSFGVAPGMILFNALSAAVSTFNFPFSVYLPYLAFVIPAFSGLRLAKFNVDERQSSSFIGLPVPAHALFWGSLLVAVQAFLVDYSLIFTAIAIPLAVFTSSLLVLEIPMFSLKIKNLKWKGNEMRYILIIGSLIFIVVGGCLGIACSIVLYVILSLINKEK